MKRLLPHPLLWLALLAMWLLLAVSLSPGSLLLGALLATLSCWALALLRPPPARIRRPALVLRLLAVVLVDVLRSNLAVAGVLLRPRRPGRRAGFIRIPLRLRNPNALAALACILTATPGTAWVEFDSQARILTLHVLDLAEEADWARTVQDRYERPLLEIFA